MTTIATILKTSEIKRRKSTMTLEQSLLRIGWRSSWRSLEMTPTMAALGIMRVRYMGEEYDFLILTVISFSGWWLSKHPDTSWSGWIWLWKQNNVTKTEKLKSSKQSELLHLKKIVAIWILFSICFCYLNIFRNDETCNPNLSLKEKSLQSKSLWIFIVAIQLSGWSDGKDWGS